ncbi:MAG: Carbamoyl-phosphate synthase small chain [Spirochaetes bacterium ADurb.Bin218]|jgi:carbamoyl-phosphate synthase small subunit|nr:MAG: Carbamoyl-phosphate synthase small chain [Spirochaetes bacterium ADurb.Bin218]HPD78034.1 glutamine-hydrolyzing carbamoyl-phosphate synthase small subunit [Spirochaetota bacterium]HRS61793.1 glutamine-hydrolyzing carbamoyl-phosphate synthase small subunit [Spirochaetota bacterium]HRU64585.1 glutamine-hydrolyzing carbamoyl-phosphate synthase small subunit [Spirochaetota bacterium]
MAQKAWFILEDGTEFEGKLFGFEGETIGEAVFNTSMSGYQEVLTDPSYCGQIVAMTYPMIGNYGVNGEDVESEKIQVAGFVVKEYSKTYSNFRATGSLGDYLKEGRIVAIEGVDTRMLTRHLRDKGAMRSGIFLDKKNAIERLKAHPQMNGLDLASKVTCLQKYEFGQRDASNPSVAVYDFGVKRNILRLLNSSGFNVTVYPAATPLKDVIADGAKGVFLSNGPGDPAAVTYAYNLVHDIVKEEIPCFGICLGHQILGLGLGGKTYKLKFGHRGGNQPVKNLATGKVEITSQNHGFAVDMDSVKNIKDVEITHLNLNDNTVEGLRHKKLPIFSVQYHPEACPGPNDSRYLFEQFRTMIR